MLSWNKTYVFAAALGLGALGLACAVRAAPAGPPNPTAAAGHEQVAIDPGLLDRYAGFYLLGDQAVLTVKRDGDHLTTQLTSQPPLPVFAESSTRFFAKTVEAQLDFQVDASGKVTGVGLRQHGQEITLPRVDAATAAQVTARTEARVKAQTASPGTEAAVRLLDTSLAAGKPAYAAMTPKLAEVTRAQLPRLQSYLSGLGAIEEVRFSGVNPQGVDVYLVRHTNGIARWLVTLDAQGKIASAWVTQGP
jgi:hypothetical protein